MNKFSRAFTLIEVLVVLLIVGVVAAIANLAFSSFGKARKFRLEIEQLEQNISMAELQAVLQPVVLQMVFVKRGYVFSQLVLISNKGRVQWQESSYAIFSRKNAFPEGLNAQLEAETQKIIFTPNGTVTPFTLTLNYEGLRYVLHVDKAGNLHAKR